jgi:hypothetical protein
MHRAVCAASGCIEVKRENFSSEGSIFVSSVPSWLKLSNQPPRYSNANKNRENTPQEKCASFGEPGCHAGRAGLV